MIYIYIWQSTLSMIILEYCPDSKTLDEAAIKTGFVVALRELLAIDPRFNTF